MQPRTEIFVPALMDVGKTILPQVWLSTVEYRTGNSAADYQKFNPPTLAESRHAYFDKNPGGSFVSPEYRQSVRSRRGYGEWTSTFLRNGTEVIERPERVFYHEKSGLWIAEGGRISKVELQPDGWAVEYDSLTGFPSGTSPNKADAEKIFGDDASYFWATGDGLRAVLQFFALDNSGYFLVSADFEPGDGGSHVGSRACRRP